MKKTLTIAALLFSLASFGQTKANLIYKETLMDSSIVYSGEAKQVKQPTNFFSNNKNRAFWQYDNIGAKLLYKVKADGTIELGDLVIEAVIKGLQEKGYVLIKVGGSTTKNKNNQ